MHLTASCLSRISRHKFDSNVRPLPTLCREPVAPSTESFVVFVSQSTDTLFASILHYTFAKCFWNDTAFAMCSLYHS